MLKDLYIRQTVETMSPSAYQVTLAAETGDGSCKVGDEIRLAQKNGRFCLLDSHEHMIDAEICANVTPEEALSLSLLKTPFTVKKTSGNVLKAEIRNFFFPAGPARNEWSYLY